MKITPPSQLETSNPEAMATPSKKVWMHQSEQRRVAGVGVSHFVVMLLFAEMKMRRHGVLEKMNQEISGKHQQENRCTCLPNEMRAGATFAASARAIRESFPAPPSRA